MRGDFKIPSKRKQFGTDGESLVIQSLQNKGLTLLDKNFHSRFGEIDLVFLNKEKLIFIEVKTTTIVQLDQEQLFTGHQIGKILKTVNYWLNEHPNYQDYEQHLIGAIVHNENVRFIRLV